MHGPRPFPARLGAVGLLCTLALGGCVSPRSTIEGTDSETLFGGVRSSWELKKPAEGEPPRTYRMLIDADVSFSSSDFTQQLDAGEIVEISGTPFIGPGPVAVSFDLLRYSADFRISMANETGLGFEGFGGLGVSQLDVELSDGAQSDSRNFTGIGPLAGIALFYEPVEWLRLFAEGSTNPSFGESVSVIDIKSVEAGASFRLHRHAALRASWRQVTYESESDDSTTSSTSDLDLEASGPALTLWLSW
jgi:hypothetical protein